MVVSAAGEVFGTVSGGCVEGAVYERCLEVLAGADACVERFAYSDTDAFAVGLTCGGTIDVLVRAVQPGSAAAADVQVLAAREESAIPTRYTLVTAGAQIGRGVVRGADDGLSGEGLGAGFGGGLGAAPGAGLGAEGDVSVDAVSFDIGVPARLIVVGAVEFAVALAALGGAMGMRVTVVDPRDIFATTARFPTAEVVVDWPDRYLATQTLDARTAVCVLSHDPKLDVPAVRAALASPAGYVGAMGSRRTHDDRMRRLAEAGVPAAARMRLRSPIGLDLGGRSPEETALSILAEIVADRHGGSGARLSGLSGAVHAGAAERSAPVPSRDVSTVSSSNIPSAGCTWMLGTSVAP